MANYRIAIISSSQALTEVNLKFRRKMSYLLGRVNPTDYEYRLRRLLRFSKHRQYATQLKVGEFIDTETDKIIKFPLFKQKGIPTEIKPYSICPKTKPQPKPKKRLLDKLRDAWNLITHETTKPMTTTINQNETQNEEDKDESEELNAILAKKAEEEETFFW